MGNTPFTNQIIQHHNGEIFSTVYSKDGQYFASGAYDRKVNIYDGGLKNRAFYEYQEDSRVKQLSDFGDTVTSVSITSDCSKIVVASWEQTISIFKHEDWSLEHEFVAHYDSITITDISPDDYYFLLNSFHQNINLRFILSASYDFTIKIWNLDNYELVYTINAYEDIILYAKYSPLGNQIISCGNDDTIRLFETISGKYTNIEVVVHCHNLNKATNLLAFSPDQQYILIAGPHHYPSNYLTILKQGTTLKEYKQYDPKIYIPDNKIVFISNFLSIEHQIKNAHKTKVQSVIFSNDGLKFFSGDRKGTIKCWDFKTQQCVYRLKGNYGCIRSLAIQPEFEKYDDEGKKIEQSYVKLIFAGSKGKLGIQYLTQFQLEPKQGLEENTKEQNKDMIVDEDDQDVQDIQVQLFVMNSIFIKQKYGQQKIIYQFLKIQSLSIQQIFQKVFHIFQILKTQSFIK